MAFKRSAVRSRLSPPNTEAKASVFFVLSENRTADLLHFNPVSDSRLAGISPLAVRASLLRFGPEVSMETKPKVFRTFSGRYPKQTQELPKIKRKHLNLFGFRCCFLRRQRNLNQRPDPLEAGAPPNKRKNHQPTLMVLVETTELESVTFRV